MCSLLNGTYISTGKNHNAQTFRPDARLYRTSACVLKRRAWGSDSDDDDRPKRYDQEDGHARSDDEGGPPIERRRYVTKNAVVSRGFLLVSLSLRVIGG
jgi:hypothetical protein